MRGEVLHYDEAQGFGFITGADGNRYTFARENLRREASVARGTAVEFQPGGGQARDIFSIGGQTADPATAAPAASAASPRAATAPAASQPQHFGRLAEDGAARDSGLWGYFWLGLTRNYINFAERARRKEFWGYCLYWMVGFILVCLIGAWGDQAIGNFDDGNGPIVTVGVLGLYVLATFMPWLGLVVRRLHDIGLPGWLVLLIFVPTFGTLAILVFGLIPTQGHENQWGPVPAGVRI